MVGLPGDRVSNMSPPTLALLAHAVWLTGLVLLMREPVARWLWRPRVWTAVIAGNGMAMTAFLWHLTAMFAATALTVGLGLTGPAIGSTEWWLLRPLWIVLLAALTLALVSAFRRADRPRPVKVPAASEGTPSRRTAYAAAGAALSVVGVLAVSAVGFGGALAGRQATLVVLPVTPLWSAVILAAGGALLVASRPRNLQQAGCVTGPTGHAPAVAHRRSPIGSTPERTDPNSSTGPPAEHPPAAVSA
jgi:hypothetical protein